MANSLNTFKSIRLHPYNQQHPVEAFFRVGRWCIMKKIFKQDYVANFWGYTINMWRDSAQSRFLAFYSHLDWQEFNFMKRYLRKGDHVFDVGANIGLYTLWINTYVGPSGKITAFEPDNKNHERLMANIELNKLTNVTVEKLALSDSTGKLNFSAGHDVFNHLVFQPQQKASSFSVDAITLDQYCQQKGISHIPLLKIDIEGAEHFAFQGAANTLRAGLIDVILFEMNHTLKRYNLQSDQVCDLLTEFGYALYDYHTDTHTLNKVDPTQIDINKQMNYFAIRDLDKVSKRVNGQL